MSKSEGISQNGTTLITQRDKKGTHQEIIWSNVILFGYMHVAALYGIILMFTSAKIATTVYAILLSQVSLLGITAGAHRLWSHRAYKAKWPLRVILIIFNSIAYQYNVFEWVRNHRLHHKYCETNTDPHNSNRGFFYSHIGWLLCEKHPNVVEKRREVDMSDILADPIVVFQKKYCLTLMPLLSFILPTMLPVYFWGESWTNSWHVATMLRHVYALNGTFLINSAAHMWGMRPYDRSINPTENVAVAFFASGEGWHNYHHVFPWDYKAAELGDYKLNLTTAFIDFFAKIGWAYDLKIVSEDIIRKRVERTGTNRDNEILYVNEDLKKKYYATCYF